jgi:uncharacterized protein with NRDE domain
MFMCVLALGWKAHPRWHLVMAGNRDELHARPTAALARWTGPGDVIAGRDLQSGGTWAGISEQGGFAVVTNLRGFGLPSAERSSRGALVAALLAGAGRYADADDIAVNDFNPFNLIVADRERALFLSNRPEPVLSPLAPGLYGLSNGALDEPWPKTLRIKEMLLDWIVSEAGEPRDLLDGLREDGLPDAGLRPQEPSDVPQEPSPSPIFIRNPVYGTRCSTVVAIDVEGRGVIIERRYSPSGDATGETALRFSWPI